MFGTGMLSNPILRLNSNYSQRNSVESYYQSTGMLTKIYEQQKEYFESSKMRLSSLNSLNAVTGNSLAKTLLLEPENGISKSLSNLVIYQPPKGFFNHLFQGGLVNLIA